MVPASAEEPQEQPEFVPQTVEEVVPENQDELLMEGDGFDTNNKFVFDGEEEYYEEDNY